MEEQKKRRKKKLTGAVIAAIVMGALLLAMAAFYLWAFQMMDRPPLALLALYIAIPAVCIIGLILALRQRIREIKGGEEDAVDQY